MNYKKIVQVIFFILCLSFFNATYAQTLSKEDIEKISSISTTLDTLKTFPVRYTRSNKKKNFKTVTGTLESTSPSGYCGVNYYAGTLKVRVSSRKCLYLVYQCNTIDKEQIGQRIEFTALPYTKEVAINCLRKNNIKNTINSKGKRFILCSNLKFIE